MVPLSPTDLLQCKSYTNTAIDTVSLSHLFSLFLLFLFLAKLILIQFRAENLCRHCPPFSQANTDLIQG